MNTQDAIRQRRTHKQFTGAPVSRELLEELLELATWAPNHRLTEPWRFYVVTHERIPALTEAVIGAIGPDAPPRMQAKRPQLSFLLSTLGAFVAVGRTPHPDPRTDQEDYGACCCAVQNLMLGATAHGLGSFWSTSAVFELPGVRSFLGMPEASQQVAALWLGAPAGQAASQRRPAAELTRWV